MKIQFIGTGSGKTSLSRFHSSFLILSGAYNLLVDCGDGISKALLSQNITYNSINGILISHLHPDHFCGLSALIIQMKINQRIIDLEIYINESLIEVVKDFIYRSYIFKEKMDFNINYIPFRNEQSYKIIDNFEFISKQNSHLDSYKVYDSSKILSFSSSSFLFTLDGLNIQYTGDIGKTQDIMLFKEFNIHTLISEISHINIPELLTSANLLKVEKLILTHISDEDESSLLKFKNTQNENILFGIITAYDGLTITI